MNLTLVLTLTTLLFIWFIIYTANIALGKINSKGNKKAFTELLIITLAFGLTVLSIFVSIHLRIDYGKKIDYFTPEEKCQIYSLGNNHSIKGSFGLFSGTIDKVEYYFFFIKNNKGFQRKEVPVKKTYLIETDSIQPQLMKMNRKYQDENKFWKIIDDYRVNHFKIYVPKNTIIRKFKVY